MKFFNLLINYSLFIKSAKEKTNALIPLIWEKDSPIYPVYSTTKCLLEIASYGQQDTKNYLMKKKSSMMMDKRLMDEGYEKGGGSGIENGHYSNVMTSLKFDGNQSDREKWQILSKELAQKQEMIHRMIKEVDDKTDAIKITVIIIDFFLF